MLQSIYIHTLLQSIWRQVKISSFLKLQYLSFILKFAFEDLYLANKRKNQLIKTNLHVVNVFFWTETFNKILKEERAKFVDKISAVGGTMGLFTGFSILSGVEILYLIWRIIRKGVYNCKECGCKTK